MSPWEVGVRRDGWPRMMMMVLGLVLTGGCGDGGSRSPTESASTKPSPARAAPELPRSTSLPGEPDVDLGALPRTAKAAWEALGQQLGWPADVNGVDGPVTLTGTEPAVVAVLELARATGANISSGFGSKLSVRQGGMRWKLHRELAGALLTATHVEHIDGALELELELWRLEPWKRRYDDVAPTVTLTVDGQVLPTVEPIESGSYGTLRWQARVPLPKSANAPKQVAIAVGGTLSLSSDLRQFDVTPPRSRFELPGLEVTDIELEHDKRFGWRASVSADCEGTLVDVEGLGADGKPLESHSSSRSTFNDHINVSRQFKQRPLTLRVRYYVAQVKRPIEVHWPAQPLAELSTPSSPGVRGRVVLASPGTDEIEVQLGCVPLKPRRNGGYATGIQGRYKPAEAARKSQTSRLANSGQLTLRLISGELRYLAEGLERGEHEVWLTVGNAIRRRTLMFDGKDVRWDLELTSDPATGIDALITDKQGKPLAGKGLKVTLLGADGKEPKGWTQPKVKAKTDAKGRLVLGGMTPGRYVVTTENAFGKLLERGQAIEVVEGKRTGGTLALGRQAP